SFFILVFFFSSRRRHTRFSRDWSSDVCSSDLVEVTNALVAYKQNPHLDQRNRGKDAAHILVHMLKDRVAVVQHLIQVPVAISIRSEERRVGKECRCEWARAD